MRLLRLKSCRVQSLPSLALLGLLALIANQVGIELFPRVPFHLGSSIVVLALLLLGNQGVLVGAASILLVPRLWNDPAFMLIAGAELLWLKLYLDHVAKPAGRCDSSWIVLADILFWILVAIPLNFLLFALSVNLDLSSVLTVTLRQGVNGSINAVVGYALFTLIRLVQMRRNPAHSISVRDLSFITLLSIILLISLVCLPFSVRELNQQFAAAQLQRLRHAAALTGVYDTSQLSLLINMRRRSGSLLEFQLFDASGRALHTSNPALFATLERRYGLLSGDPASRLRLAEPLDLIFPAGETPGPKLPPDSYLRYTSSLDRGPREGLVPLVPQDRIVVMVEPAKGTIRDLESHSELGLNLLGVLLALGALLAEWLASTFEKQFPRGALFEPVSGRSAFRVDPCSPLQELRVLLGALLEQQTRLETLNEELQRTDQQRRRLEAEVSRLNILDPLTGCFNPREFYRRLDHEVSLGNREVRMLSVLCLEIDHLRAIQESYGETASEEILRRVAFDIRSRSRTTDCLCRLGQDQFALLLTSCDADAAGPVADQLTEAISALEIRHESSLLAVTVSVGVAVLQPGRDDSESLITRAQRALFRAKAEGRNRVVIA